MVVKSKSTVFHRALNRINVWILIIVIIGSLLRLLDLNNIPSGFHYDEAQSAYNGFLISNHLKNIHGEFLPTDIDYFKDFRPVLNSYLSAVTVKLFGNTEIAGRLPAAIFASITILLAYILSLKLFQKRSIATIAALFMAISPFHIIFSRSSADGAIDITLSTLAIILCLKYLDGGRKKWLPVILIIWIVSFYTYQTGRLLIPLLTLSLIFTNWLQTKTFEKSKWLLLALAIFLIFPLGYSLITKKGASRFNQVSIFVNPETQRSLNQIITESGVVGINPVFVRLFNNKVISYSLILSKNYLFFFSPDNILFDENIQPLRYKVAPVGLITLYEYLGLLCAFYFFIKNKSRGKFAFPFLALLLAPLPAALTSTDFQRAIYLLPYWQILAAFGIFNVLTSLQTNQKKIIYLGGIFLLIFEFVFFCYQYFLISPIHEPFYRNYERKDLAVYLGNNLNKKILLSDYDGTYIFYLYFNKLDIFNSTYEKQGKYFENNFSLSGLTFRKNECLDTEDIFSGRYDILVDFEKCGSKKYFFLDKAREFRRKDNSLVLIAYNIDKSIYTLQDLALTACNKYWKPDEKELEGLYINRANILKKTEDKIIKCF